MFTRCEPPAGEKPDCSEGRQNADAIWVILIVSGGITHLNWMKPLKTETVASVTACTQCGILVLQLPPVCFGSAKWSLTKHWICTQWLVFIVCTYLTHKHTHTHFWSITSVFFLLLFTFWSSRCWCNLRMSELQLLLCVCVCVFTTVRTIGCVCLHILKQASNFPPLLLCAWVSV